MEPSVYYAIGTFIACLGLAVLTFFYLDRKINAKEDKTTTAEQWKAINSMKDSMAKLMAENAKLGERSESILREIASLRKDLRLDARMEHIESYIIAGGRQ